MGSSLKHKLFPDGQSASARRMHRFWAPVEGLLRLRGPAAVAGFVVAVVLDAVDRVLRRRSRPHVRVERRVVVEPTIAHQDAAASVVLVALVVRIEAAFLHRTPDCIFRRSRSLVPSPVTLRPLTL